MKVDLEGDRPISLEVKVEGEVVPVNDLSEPLDPDNVIGKAIRKQVLEISAARK